MVSLKSESIKSYIAKHSENSLLLKSFCNHLFRNKLAPKEIEFLSRNIRDYKLIAAQGYSINEHDNLKNNFCLLYTSPSPRD